MSQAPAQSPDGDGELPGLPSAARRKFVHRMLNMTLGFWALAGVAGSGYVAGQYVWPRKEAGTTGGERSVTFPLSELEGKGMVKKLVDGEPVGIFVVDGNYHAVHLVCTHLGCLVSFDKKEGNLACPCHGSRFDPNGAVLSSPAPAPLRAYDVRVAGDTVVVS
jgi:Rieske Fe-S protein